MSVRRWRDVAAPHSDRGAGLFGTWFGMVVVLVLFLFAVQVLFDLYARSVVTATAYDAARRVAGHRRGSLANATAAAEASARASLGRYGERLSFEWDLSDPTVVRLRVLGENPRLGFAGLGGPLRVDRIDRAVSVRVEQAQP